MEPKVGIKLMLMDFPKEGAALWGGIIATDVRGEGVIREVRERKGVAAASGGSGRSGSPDSPAIGS